MLCLIVDINDDFDLEKIAHCGQCFRAKKIFSDIYRFITGNRVIYISRKNDTQLDLCCDELDWSNTWADYFDLETNYKSIRAEVGTLNDYLKNASDFGAGIRILLVSCVKNRSRRSSVSLSLNAKAFRQSRLRLNVSPKGSGAKSRLATKN